MSPNDNKSSGQSGKGKKGRPDDKFEWKKATRTLSFWILIILGTIVIAQLIQMGEPKEKDLTYSEFQELLDQGQILDGTVIDREFHGRYRTGALGEGEFGRFKTILPPYMDQEIFKRWAVMRPFRPKRKMSARACIIEGAIRGMKAIM